MLHPTNAHIDESGALLDKQKAWLAVECSE